MMSRRDTLRRLSAGTLLALGVWPGRLRAAENGRGGSFRFIVVNDTHLMSDECGAHLRGVVAQMKRENAEFCLHAGDLTEKGGKEHLGAMSEIFRELGRPFHPVIGNHDYLTQTDRSTYDAAFPDRINYSFRHGGWQFVGLDSSDGLLYEKTSIQPATLRWIDDHLPRLDKTVPTVVFTHFPLGADVTYRPHNADALLDRFREYNLQAVFCGHFHGFTERKAGGATLTTNRCCALKRNNHDKSKEKGYFVCDAGPGGLERKFVEFKPAGAA